MARACSSRPPTGSTGNTSMLKRAEGRIHKKNATPNISDFTDPVAEILKKNGHKPGHSDLWIRP